MVPSISRGAGWEDCEIQTDASQLFQTWFLLYIEERDVILKKR